MTQWRIFDSIKPTYYPYMRSILKNTSINALSLFFTSQLLSGIKISGGLTTYLIGGFALSLMFLILRPLLSIIALPLNLITFGAFSFVINAAILYLLTIFVPGILVTSFVFPGVNFFGFIIPHISFNIFFAFIAVSIVLSCLVSFLSWLTKS